MVLVVPSLPIFLILAAYIRRWDLLSMSLLLGLFGWPYVARVIRAQVISMRERPYVDLARITGANDLEIIFLELLPNLLPYLGFCLAGAAVGAMLTEAGLQLIGLGARGLPTLGFIIGQGLSLGVIGVGFYGQMLMPDHLLDPHLHVLQPDQYGPGGEIQSPPAHDRGGQVAVATSPAHA